MSFRKATATKYGKIHIANGNMTLCLQYAGKNDENIKEPVNCKRCISKAKKMNWGAELIEEVEQ